MFHSQQCHLRARSVSFSFPGVDKKMCVEALILCRVMTGKPVWLSPFRVAKDVLLSNPIIRPVGNERILVAILFWHGHRRQRPPCRLKLGRRELVEPHNVFLTTVLLLCPVAMTILLAKGDAELAEPDIVVEALTHPYGARMLLVLYREVATLMRVHSVGGSGEIGNY